MNINLHIERLVFEGVPLGDGDSRRVQAALQAELARLIRDGTASRTWSSGQAVASVRAADIQLATGEDPGFVGRQIAGALYGGIVR